MQVPPNAFGLTRKDLETVKDRMVRMTGDKNVDPKDRVAAGKLVASIHDQIMKRLSSPGALEEEEEQDDPLKGLRLVS